MIKRTAESIEFQKIWAAARSGEELVPQRAGISPQRFKTFLPKMGIHEVDVENDRFIIRLLGAYGRNVMGFDPRGFDTNSFIEPKQLPFILERLKSYHEQPCGRVLIARFVRGDGESGIYEHTYLPFWGEHQERLVCSLVTVIHRPMQLDFSVEPSKSYSTLAEEVLDIGGGVPDYEYDLSQVAV